MPSGLGEISDTSSPARWDVVRLADSCYRRVVQNMEGEGDLYDM